MKSTDNDEVYYIKRINRQNLIFIVEEKNRFAGFVVGSFTVFINRSTVGLHIANKFLLTNGQIRRILLQIAGSVHGSINIFTSTTVLFHEWHRLGNPTKQFKEEIKSILIRSVLNPYSVNDYLESDWTSSEKQC